MIFFIECAAPPLDRVEVRRALNYAVDRERLIREVLHGRGTPLNGPFSDRHFAHDPDIAPYPYDPEKARELLASAGVGGGFRLTIHAPTKIPSEGPALAAFLADSFRRVGIDAVVQLHGDRYRYASDVAGKKLHGLFCFDSSPLSSFKVLREKLDSGFAGTWWQGYHSDRVNALIAEAAARGDDSGRREIYRKACRSLHDEAPWVFLYQAERFWLSRRNDAAGAPGLKVDDLGFFIS